MKLSDKKALIERILNAAAAQDAQRIEVAERFELLCSDGQWHSSDLPRGVSYPASNPKRPYYVRRSVREGTTHGQRFKTRAELESKMKKYATAQRAEFKAELVKLNGNQLQECADYWLKGF